MAEFCQKANTNARHPGEFWKKIAPLLPNSKSKNQKTSGTIFFENKTIITETRQSAEIFNINYFTEGESDRCKGSIFNDFSDHLSIKSIDGATPTNKAVNVDCIYNMHNLESR